MTTHTSETREREKEKFFRCLRQRLLLFVLCFSQYFEVSGEEKKMRSEEKKKRKKTGQKTIKEEVEKKNLG